MSTSLKIAIGCIFVVALAAAFPSLNEPIAPTVAAPEPSPAKHVVGDNYTVESWQTNGASLACDRVEDIEKFIDFAGSQDKAAIDRYFAPLLVRKQCVVVAKNTKVFISEASIFGSTIRVRVRGETAYHYVVRDVLEMIEG